VLCSTEPRDKKISHTALRRWYAQEESNLQPRSGPELTTGISRPLCQLSYGRSLLRMSLSENRFPLFRDMRNGQGGWIRTNGLLHPRQALSPD
jgi:hypothetical protein